MNLKQLSLLNYRNFEELNLDFSERINCLIGNNGVGKTNILDSIYFLSFCKSWLNPIDIQNIRYDSDYFMIKGQYEINQISESISCGLAKGKRKSFKRGAKEYEKLSDHIGLIPLISISPYDTVLISGNSDERRKFMDIVISQFDKEYLHKLLKYNRILLQRNQLLKQIFNLPKFDKISLEVWDDQLIQIGNDICEKRKIYVENIVPIFQQFYSEISEGRELVSLEYRSQLNEGDFKTLLNDSFEKDRMLQFTSVGIHKDDLLFVLNLNPLKKHASQGQQKTYLISLKLAQSDYIKSNSGTKPILLFDDIFDKLDASRVKQIMKLISGHDFGQIFITDTNHQRIKDVMKEIEIPYKLFLINGEIIESEFNAV
jgi:DNA replication and repair protein RecF